MPSSQDLVIFFTRFPSPGKCKSRLIPHLGVEGALKTHKRLVSHTMQTVNAFRDKHKETGFLIYYDGGSQLQMVKWLGSDYHYKRQAGNDLGQRMANALIHGLSRGKNCILIGSDCPGITADLLGEALHELATQDMVLGPAHDGGYYLVGLAHSVKPDICAELFQEIPWGTAKVCSKTMERASQLGINLQLLKTLHDIDEPEDLKYFNHCPDPE